MADLVNQAAELDKKLQGISGQKTEDGSDVGPRFRMEHLFVWVYTAHQVVGEMIHYDKDKRNKARYFLRGRMGATCSVVLDNGEIVVEEDKLRLVMSDFMCFAYTLKRILHS